MFLIASHYILKNTLYKNENDLINVSINSIIISIIIYAALYIYFYIHGGDMFTYFNTVLIYIIGVDLLLSALYYHNTQQINKVPIYNTLPFYKDQENVFNDKLNLIDSDEDYDNSSYHPYDESTQDNNEENNEEGNNEEENEEERNNIEPNDYNQENIDKCDQKNVLSDKNFEKPKRKYNKRKNNTLVNDVVESTQDQLPL